MSKTKSRRNFLGTGAVVSMGVALGAFSRAGLAKQPRTMTKNAFLDRADKPLSDAEIRRLVVGNTLVGVTYKGGEYLAYLNKDGSVDKMIDDRRETGRWKIADGTLYLKFPTLASGEEFGLQIYKYRTSPLYKGYSPSEKRWTWFVTEPGKAKELA